MAERCLGRACNAMTRRCPPRANQLSRVAVRPVLGRPIFSGAAVGNETKPSLSSIFTSLRQPPPAPIRWRCELWGADYGPKGCRPIAPGPETAKAFPTVEDNASVVAASVVTFE